jgi:hypothetical protein
LKLFHQYGPSGGSAAAASGKWIKQDKGKIEAITAPDNGRHAFGHDLIIEPHRPLAPTGLIGQDKTTIGRISWPE